MKLMNVTHIYLAKKTHAIIYNYCFYILDLHLIILRLLHQKYHMVRLECNIQG